MKIALTVVAILVGVFFAVVTQAQTYHFERKTGDYALDVKQEQTAEEIIKNYSPLDRYISREDFKKIAEEVMSKQLQHQVIVIDTRNEVACRKLLVYLKEIGWPAEDSLCAVDYSNPFVSLNIATEVPERLRQELAHNNGSMLPQFDFERSNSERRQQLMNRTRNIALLSGGVVLAFANQEEDESGWDMQGLRDNGALAQMRKHYKEGPVMDKDGPFVNFVLHPISGSIYYQAARLSGYGKMQSFGYSFLMSTFFWEYGVESVFETPSWNDIFATPILGSLIGEVFLKYYQKIEDNNNKVLGSKFLGFTAKMALNSAEALRPYINSIFKSEILKDGRAGFTTAPCDIAINPVHTGKTERYCPFFSISYSIGH